MDNAVPKVQLKRVNPFMGLMIDAEPGDSHDYLRSTTLTPSPCTAGASCRAWSGTPRACRPLGVDTTWGGC